MFFIFITFFLPELKTLDKEYLFYKDYISFASIEKVLVLSNYKAIKCQKWIYKVIKVLLCLFKVLLDSTLFLKKKS